MKVDKDYYDNLIMLISVASCPVCDGSGSYPDGIGEQVQCQWCYGRNEVIDKVYKDSEYKHMDRI